MPDTRARCKRNILSAIKHAQHQQALLAIIYHEYESCPDFYAHGEAIYELVCTLRTELESLYQEMP